jgi:hypothetical protein
LKTRRFTFFAGLMDTKKYLFSYGPLSIRGTTQDRYNTPPKKIYWLKGYISGSLETRRFALLGKPYGYKEVFISIWIFLY